MKKLDADDILVDLTRRMAEEIAKHRNESIELRAENGILRSINKAHWELREAEQAVKGVATPLFVFNVFGGIGGGLVAEVCHNGKPDRNMISNMLDDWGLGTKGTFYPINIYNHANEIIASQSVSGFRWIRDVCTY